MYVWRSCDGSAAKWSEKHVETLVDYRLRTMSDAAITWDEVAEHVNKTCGTAYTKAAVRTRFQQWQVSCLA